MKVQNACFSALSRLTSAWHITVPAFCVQITTTICATPDGLPSVSPHVQCRAGQAIAARFVSYHNNLCRVLPQKLDTLCYKTAFVR